MSKTGWVYIIANRYRGTIYIGVTSSLAHRISQHREGTGAQFAKRHDRTRLILAEPFERIEDAIARETAEALEPGVEDQTNRGAESRLARPVRRDRQTVMNRRSELDPRLRGDDGMGGGVRGGDVGVGQRKWLVSTAPTGLRANP